MKLQEENAALKNAYEVLQKNNDKLKQRHAEDNGELLILVTNLGTKSFHYVTL